MQGWAPTKNELQQFLHQHQHCVVSTLGPDGAPQGATVAFSENSQLNLIIGTSTSSRKYANLRRDPRIAITITNPEKRFTVQYQGAAHTLTPKEFAAHEKGHFAKLPGSLPFKDVPDQAYLLITPSLIRFSDCSVFPWLVTEFQF